MLRARVDRSVVVAAIILGLGDFVAAAPLGKSITYQGQLKQSGTAVNGAVDLQVSLWDDAGAGSPPSGGTQVGTTQSLPAVVVTNGLFTAVLNAGGEFGESPFDGAARWLQITVNGTTLSPRQPLAPAPQALFANNTRGILVDDDGRVAIGQHILPQGTFDPAFIVFPPQIGKSIQLRSTGGRSSVPSGGSGGATITMFAGDNTPEFNGLGEGADIRITGGTGSIGNKGGDITLTAGSGGLNNNGPGGAGGNIRIFPGAGGSSTTTAGAQGIMFVEGAVGIGTRTPPPVIPLTLAPWSSDIALLIRPEALTLNNSVSICFVDPDGGTGPMYLRYTDNGAPAIEAVGGPLRAPDFVKTSSGRYKHDVKPLPAGTLERLLKLRPVTYAWDAEHGGGRDVGLIAEEVAAAIPEAVYEAGGRPEGISYPVLTTMALKGLGEQQAQIRSMAVEKDEAIRSLRAENEQLRARLERLEAAVRRMNGE